jgi:sugar lactone lactonase YvrE
MAEQRQEETAMDNHPKSRSLLVLCLIVGLALLGCPRAGSAAGTWSMIATQGGALGQVDFPSQAAALAVDGMGNLYVADDGRVQKRDSQGNWSLIATTGDGPGEVDFAHGPSALTVDSTGNLYVADSDGTNKRIQQLNVQGSWSVIATIGADPSKVSYLSALAADAAGNLYVAYNEAPGRIQKLDTQGNWTNLPSPGDSGDPIGGRPIALAVDPASNIFVAEIGDGFTWGVNQIQRRSAQGNWSTIADEGSGPGQVHLSRGLAVDTAGNLYVADTPGNDYRKSRIQKRDTQGNWSVIATFGSALGQVSGPGALAVDPAGNLYVADILNNRVLKYTPGP